MIKKESAKSNFGKLEKEAPESQDDLEKLKNKLL